MRDELVKVDGKSKIQSITNVRDIFRSVKCNTRISIINIDIDWKEWKEKYDKKNI
jgi:hypothetical protein